MLKPSRPRIFVSVLLATGLMGLAQIPVGVTVLSCDPEPSAVGAGKPLAGVPA